MVPYSPPNIQFKPLFSELWDRGRYSIPQFARDFLDIDLWNPDFPKIREWYNTEVWAIERGLTGGNRSGKSFAAAIKHLHGLLYQPRHKKYRRMTHRYIRVNLSLTLDMAEIPYQIAVNRAFDSPLYRPFILEDQCRDHPFPVFVVGTGGKGKDSFRSELWARSSSKGAKYLLGKDLDFVNYDECAFDPAGEEVLNNVVMMRLADRNGQVDYTTAPNGKNWYYERFRQMMVKPELQEPPHYTWGMIITSFDNPYVDHDRLRVNEKRMTPEMVKQNIYAVFLDINGVFNADDIESAYRDIDYHLPQEPVGGATYLKAFDFAFRHDKTVGLVARVDVTPAQLVYVGSWGGEGSGVGFVGEGGIYEQVSRIHNKYKGSIYGDSTGPAGKIILETLTKEYKVPMQESDVSGMRGKRKEDLLMAGKQALSGRRIVWPYCEDTRPLINELRYYQLPDENIATDHTMAFCILSEGMRKESYMEADEPIVSIPVWGNARGVYSAGEGDYACTCQLTRDLDYCRTHHLPSNGRTCCGGEGYGDASVEAARMLHGDMALPEGWL